MKSFVQIQPPSKRSLLKIAILKTMMSCGVVWGLYHPKHKGWAIRSVEGEHIFPFWLSSIHALHYAKVHWPSYEPRQISSQDFIESLLPTLSRFEVSPALYNHQHKHFKLSLEQMRLLFFQAPMHLTT